MKQKLLKTIVLGVMALWGGQTWAQQANSVTNPTYDVWVRTDNTSAISNGDALEIKTYTGDSKNEKFYSLLQFTFTAPQEGYQVKCATLRLTTRYKKGDDWTYVYPLYADVTNSNPYSDVGTAIEKALAGDPIATFQAKGYSDKALWDSGLSSEYQNVAAWQNSIDLTNFVKTLGTNKFAIVLRKPYDQNNSTKFYPSEKNTNENINADANNQAVPADLVPQLTVEYETATWSRTTTTGTVSGWMSDGNINGTNGEIELKNQVYGDPSTTNLFYGLLHFNLPEARGKEFVGASLRLVTERAKNDIQTNVYQLGAEVKSNSKYSELSSAITTALANSFVATFDAAGAASCIKIDNQTEDYRTIDKWTNNINLNISGVMGSTLDLMLYDPKVRDSNNDSKRFFGVNSSGFTNTQFTPNLTVTQGEIVPKLTLVYKTMDSYTLTIGDAMAATLCLPFNATIPDGIKAYTLNYTGGDHVTAVEVTGGTLTANTPVLINATAVGDYTFTRTSDIMDGSSTSGALTGVYLDTKPGEGHYILTNHGGNVAFRKTKTSNKVAPYRAYLTVETQAPEFLEIDFSGNTTGVDEKVTVEKNADGIYYNLSGQRVQNPTKGLYIVNGKKVIIK